MTFTLPRLRIALPLVALAAAGGITATIAQGDDPPATASFRTVDGSNVFQLTSGSGTSTSAQIVTGGTVTFTNSSTEMHDVDFTAPAGGGVTCQQTVGGTSPSTLRFPTSPATGTWAGVCTFAAAGTYSFRCEVHQHMTGTVVVTNPTPPPGTTTTTPTTTGTTPVQMTPTGSTTSTPTQTLPTSTTSTPSGSSPTTPGSNAAQAPVSATRTLSIRVGLTQRGPVVRGTISGARGSGRVKIALTARRAAIGLAGKPAAPVGVGTLSTLTTRTGALTFVARLDAKARAALARRGRLALTVHVTALPAAGAATLRTFQIVLRPT